MDLERSVFLVGMPRSGTTIIYEALAMHEELGWFSSFHARLPRLDFLEAISRIYDVPYIAMNFHGLKPQYRQGQNLYNKFLPKPAEGWNVWRRLCGDDFCFGFLKGAKASPEESQRCRRGVARVLSYQGKSRFLSKTVGPPHIEYLGSIFPQAYFIQIVRDGRAVVNSLMNFSSWKEQGGFYKPFWDDGLAENWLEEWQSYGQTPQSLAAMQWRLVQQISHEEASNLPPDRYLLVRYEDFIADPSRVIHKIQSFCELPMSNRVERSLRAPDKFKNMNYKYKKAFSSEEIKVLEGIMEPWLSRYGYLDA